MNKHCNYLNRDHDTFKGDLIEIIIELIVNPVKIERIIDSSHPMPNP